MPPISFVGLTAHRGEPPKKTKTKNLPNDEDGYREFAQDRILEEGKQSKIGRQRHIMMDGKGSREEKDLLDGLGGPTSSVVDLLLSRFHEADRRRNLFSTWQSAPTVSGHNVR